MNKTNELEMEGTRSLLHTLAAVAHMIDDRLDAALAPHGLSMPKLSALRVLVQAGEPLPLGELSARLGCVKSNVTQLVDRLGADGLVRRMPDPEDRRSVLAVITDEGRRRYEAGMQAVAEAEREVLRSISPEEREQLTTLLRRFEA